MNELLDNYINGWKRIVDFEGISNRAQFWTFTLTNGIINMLISELLGSLLIISSIFSILVFIAGLAISIRRLRDINKSGWNLLWYFIPLIGWIILLVYFCEPSR